MKNILMFLMIVLASAGFCFAEEKVAAEQEEIVQDEMIPEDAVTLKETPMLCYGIFGGATYSNSSYGSVFGITTLVSGKCRLGLEIGMINISDLTNISRINFTTSLKENIALKLDHRYIGGDVLINVYITESIFVTEGAGLYVHDIDSYVDGILQSQERQYRMSIVSGIGIDLIPGVSLEAGYHSILGALLKIGVKF